MKHDKSRLSATSGNVPLKNMISLAARRCLKARGGGINKATLRETVGARLTSAMVPHREAWPRQGDRPVQACGAPSGRFAAAESPADLQKSTCAREPKTTEQSFAVACRFTTAGPGDDARRKETDCAHEKGLQRLRRRIVNFGRRRSVYVRVAGMGQPSTQALRVEVFVR